MKVQNMTNDKGRAIPNQFIITNAAIDIIGFGTQFDCVVFQSFDSVICVRSHHRIYLDEKYWDYSNPTGKYRNQFLGESIAETRKKIASGEYILCNLN